MTLPEAQPVPPNPVPRPEPPLPLPQPEPAPGPVPEPEPEPGPGPEDAFVDPSQRAELEESVLRSRSGLWFRFWHGTGSGFGLGKRKGRLRTGHRVRRDRLSFWQGHVLR